MKSLLRKLGVSSRRDALEQLALARRDLCVSRVERLSCAAATSRGSVARL